MNLLWQSLFIGYPQYKSQPLVSLDARGELHAQDAHVYWVLASGHADAIVGNHC